MFLYFMVNGCRLAGIYRSLFLFFYFKYLLAFLLSFVTMKILDFKFIYLKTRITNDFVHNLQQCKLAPYPQGYMFQNKSFLLNECWALQPDISSSSVNF